PSTENQITRATSAPSFPKVAQCGKKGSQPGRNARRNRPYTAEIGIARHTTALRSAGMCPSSTGDLVHLRTLSLGARERHDHA
ncbi:MAG TPA: hypothetical protein VFV38_03770, partial [Ktedonobacteraceae bacterium]|nr:hypothetical protein [Ktedonobacteraceae bacterium]